MLELRPRRSNRVTVSLARRADVAALDKLLSPTDGVDPSPAGIGPSRTP
jgi:hypothetical protein